MSSNFTHIESFQHVIKTVEYINKSEASFKYLTPVCFRGTIKLHGTNGGVTVDLKEETVVAQSRSRIITIQRDNAGFAMFVKSKKDIFLELGKQFLEDNVSGAESVSFFGEWIGKSIQKGTAINKLENKQFVIFSIRLNRGEKSSYYLSEERLDEIQSLPEDNIYKISDAGTWKLSHVDFQNRDSLQSVLEEATEITQEVELQCPWGKLFGCEGIGEGVVWKPIGEHSGRTDLFFKTKGEKHKVVEPKDRTKVSIDPEVSDSIEEFVKFSTPDTRLQQGIDSLKEQGISIEPKNTGHYIRWVSQDVLRECEAELVASKLTWKQVVGQISRTARDFWIKETNKIEIIE